MIRGINRRTPAGGFEVYIDEELLDPGPSQKIVNHSPDGFAWGYPGSGPSQLALALLLHFTGNAEYAAKQYQYFKFDVVAKLSPLGFRVEDSIVTDWIKAHP